jgi:FixJ family two-component response regulator
MHGGRRHDGVEKVAEAVIQTRPLISIVEDDQPFRESMKKLMTSLGYSAEAFASAADFLASPLLPVTACLVSDVQMPGMTGIELHRYLVDAGRRIPTILVTACSNRTGVPFSCMLRLGMQMAMRIHCTS